MTQEHTSTTVPQQEPNQPALLPMYSQQIISTLTPRQLRAALAGQRYYLTHQNGTHATHAQLCAFLKHKRQRWQYTNTSTEWQIYFISGWHMALLADPTAEKERPTAQAQEPQQPAAIQAGQESGNDGGWNAPNAPIMARRPDCGREDEEDAAIKAQQRPTRSKDDDEDRRPECDEAAPITGARPGATRDDLRAVTVSAAISARAVFGPENDDEPGEHHPTRRPEDGDEPEGPITAATLRQRITAALALQPPQRPSEDPEEDEDEELEAAAQPHNVTGGCYVMHQQEEAAARPAWEPEDDDDGARSIPGPIPEQRGGAFLLTTPGGYPAFPLPLINNYRADFESALPAFFPAAMVVVENDSEDIADWPSLLEDQDQQREPEEDRGGTVPRVAASAAARWGRYHTLKEQRGGVIPTWGDEDDRGAGWLVIRPGARGPWFPEEDDGGGFCPAFLPFPHKPAGGAAVLVARQHLQEAATCQ